ncbi:MAG: 2,4-dihydroxyhept-2-ene-1,7-dioic acid aldolase [Pelagibacteraceae bacterium]|nr:2,4-dihydroxyhept-2-ene-1,7-dioic acid aldolase [Pelagibacteraceae bacterium]|tara:strand:- start:1265 stop:2086 length:822 start_codon:yes stop_codon:yes gene_type:complete
MIENKLKKLWANNKPSLNGWLSIPSPFGAEIMAEQGYDSLTIDMQHGAIDYSDCLSMLQAMRASGVVPIARIPWLDHENVMKALDAGCLGLICPMVDTRVQAEELVSYCKYPPNGVRSFGPSRANISLGSNYWKESEKSIFCLAMIETQEAYDNVEEIASTPGLDGLYIGPADLTLGLGKGKLSPGFDREEPMMLEAIKNILAAAKKNNKVAALHCGSPEYAAKGVTWGFDMVTISNDIRLLVSASSTSVKKFRNLTDGENKETESKKDISTY